MPAATSAPTAPPEPAAPAPAPAPASSDTFDAWLKGVAGSRAKFFGRPFFTEGPSTEVLDPNFWPESVVCAE